MNKFRYPSKAELFYLHVHICVHIFIAHKNLLPNHCVIQGTAHTPTVPLPCTWQDRLLKNKQGILFSNKKKHTFNWSLVFAFGFKSLETVPLLILLTSLWCFNSTRFSWKEYQILPLVIDHYKKTSKCSIVTYVICIIPKLISIIKCVICLCCWKWVWELQFINQFYHEKDHTKAKTILAALVKLRLVRQNQ